MSAAYTNSIKSSPFVSPTLSASTDLILGQTAGGRDLYGYKITDTSVLTPKTKVVLTAGDHNVETTGNFALQGMLDFLLSSDTEAVALRELAEFYVYPLVNPDGRATGTGRGNPEMTAEGFGIDHNRVWDRGGEGLSTIDTLTAAMQNDTGGDVDYLFNFHSAGSNFFFTVPSLVNSPYSLARAARDPNVPPVASNGQPGMTRIWSMSQDGLQAEFAFTPEQGFSGTEETFFDIGADYGLALFDVLVIDNADFDGDGFVNGNDFLVWQRGVGTGTSLVDGDANGDGAVDAADLAIWEVQFGSPAVMGSSSVTGVAVPEPATVATLAVMGVVALLRRRRAA